MATYRNISACVLALLEQGAQDYKSIANKVREHFPNAVTTHKSVASLAKDFRKKGLLARKGEAPAPMPVEDDEEQFSMFPIFQALEWQLALI